MLNIKSSLEVVIKSLTKNDLLLRDLTSSRPILMVLLIGFKVDIGLEGIGMRFSLFNLSGNSRNAKLAMY